MKATTLLEKQHRKVEAIFKKLEAGRTDAPPLLKELADDLCAHMAIEQDIFYPAIRAINEDLVHESFEEHAVAELAMKRLLSTSPDDPSFMARVVVLKELIEHHVDEEEEELFPQVEKAMSESDLTSLGTTMQKRFNALNDAGYETLLPSVFARTTADQAQKKLDGATTPEKTAKKTSRPRSTRASSERPRA